MWKKLAKRKPRGDPQNLERITQLVEAKAITAIEDEIITYEDEIKAEEN